MGYATRVAFLVHHAEPQLVRTFVTFCERKKRGSTLSDPFLLPQSENLRFLTADKSL